MLSLEELQSAIFEIICCSTPVTSRHVIGKVEALKVRVNGDVSGMFHSTPVTSRHVIGKIEALMAKFQ